MTKTEAQEMVDAAFNSEFVQGLTGREIWQGYEPAEWSCRNYNYETALEQAKKAMS